MEEPIVQKIFLIIWTHAACTKENDVNKQIVNVGRVSENT